MVSVQVLSVQEVNCHSDAVSLSYPVKLYVFTWKLRRHVDHRNFITES